MLERPEATKEYNPENYLNALSRLFANQDTASKIKEIKQTPESDITDAEYKNKIQTLEKKLLSDEEYQKLDDASILQLQNDICILHNNNPNTLEQVAKSREKETTELMRAWNESGPSVGGIAPPSRMDKEAVQARKRVGQSLRNILQEVAEKNGWKISFLESSEREEEPACTCTWRMEQEIYVFDGKRTVTIDPSLFKFEDVSALGDYQIPNMELSHLRKYIVLTEGNVVDTKNPDLKTQSIIYIVNGSPDIDRMPSREEIEFMEKVVAAYY